MSKDYIKKVVCFGDSNTYGYNAKIISCGGRRTGRKNGLF